MFFLFETKNAQNTYSEFIRESMQETPSHFAPQGSSPFHVDDVFLNCFCNNNIMSIEHIEMHDHPFISNIKIVKKSDNNKLRWNIDL